MPFIKLYGNAKTYFHSMYILTVNLKTNFFHYQNIASYSYSKILICTAINKRSFTSAKLIVLFHIKTPIS